MNTPKLSLCIPTMDRWEFLSKNLEDYIKNPYIDEIVISDENGNDADKIKKYFNETNKIVINVNNKKLGVYKNKEKVVSLSKNDWVCLIDSDNFAPLKYFEEWGKYIEKNGIDNSVIYSPSKTTKQKNHNGFDFINVSGVMIDSSNFKKYFKINDVFFNLGNYIFNKHNYIKYGTKSDEKNLEITCYAVDVLYKNYLLITRGNMKLFGVPNMEYNHIVHNGSEYTKTIKMIDTKYYYSLYN